jgi:DNA-binding PadR family transcriptional regulator
MAKKRITTQKGRPRGSGGAERGGLTTADLIVLSLLAERAMHGYELLGEYDRQEVADWASVSKAQVYYAIQKLVGLELIAPVPEPAAESQRDRTVYAPTKRGHRELAASLASLDWARGRVAQPFATWMGLSVHLKPDAVAATLAARKQFMMDELARERESLKFIKTLKSARAKAGQAIVTLVIRQIEVELDWIQNLMEADR